MSSQKSVLDFVKHVFDSTLRMVTLADNKASLAIAVQSLIFSFGLGSILLSDIFDIIPTLKLIYFILFIGLCVVLVVGTIFGVSFAVLVFIDRIRKPADGFSGKERKRIIFFRKLRRKREEKLREKLEKQMNIDPYYIKGMGILYFKHILVKFPTVDLYIEENLKEYKGPDTHYIREYSLQVYSVSKTLVKKFRWVNRSIAFLLFNLILSAALIITDIIVLVLN